MFCFIFERPPYQQLASPRSFDALIRDGAGTFIYRRSLKREDLILTLSSISLTQASHYDKLRKCLAWRSRRKHIDDKYEELVATLLKLLYNWRRQSRAD